MNNLNSILIEGNLTKDPKLSETPKGTPVCTFGLASNRYYKPKDGEPQTEVSFFDVEAWAKLGEVCSEYLVKGRGVRVVGRLKQDRWSDKEGNPVSRVKIVAEHIEFKPNFKAKDGEEELAGTEEEEVVEEEERIEEVV